MAETKRDRVAAELRSLVSGLQAGDKLPSISELVTHHGASVNTIRKALLTLDQEGLIRVEHGAGSYVLAAPDTPPVPAVLHRDATQRLSRDAREANVSGHNAEAQALGQASTVDVRPYFERADTSIAAELGITPGDEVVVRERIMRIGGVPTQLATSRIPRAISRGTQIEDDDTGRGGIHARLEELGYSLAPATERVRIREASESDARLLRIKAGAATFRLVRTVPEVAGRILESTTMTLTDRYELIYPVPTD